MKEKIIELIEKYFSIAISLLFILAIYIKIDMLVYVRKFDIIMTSIITIAVTLIGALLTVLTILIAIVNSKIAKVIHSNGLWNSFVNDIGYTILIGFVSVLYSLYMIIIEVDDIVHKIDIIVIGFIFSLFILQLVKICILILKIIKLLPRTGIEFNDEEAGATLDEEDILKYHNKDNDI